VKTTDMLSLLTGQVLEEELEMTLADLCRASQLPAEQVIEFVEYGVIEPRGEEPGAWRFAGISLRRIHSARRLQRDLGVNTAGVALALELLEEMEQLRARLRRLEK
jgi:chaperone modulatory protein CbpM